MLKTIHSQEDKEATRKKAEDVVAKLRALKLEKAAKIVESGNEGALSYCDFPVHHRRSIKPNNPLERLNREIRRRTRVVDSFPNGQSALIS